MIDGTSANYWRELVKLQAEGGNAEAGMKDLAIFLAAAAGLVLVFHGLVDRIGSSHTWMSFIYFYGLGWLVYVYVSRLMIRAKALDLKKSSDRVWFCVVTGGLVFFCSLHGFWIWISTVLPYRGDV